jgi:hypothetical protein
MVYVLIMIPTLTYAQNNQAYNIIKSKESESFTFPYNATNHDIKNPLVYTYDQPKTSSWIITIRNNLTYVETPGAKTVVKIQEPSPSQKYIELVMYGDQSRKFLVSINEPDKGYSRIYNGDLGGWSTDLQPITLGEDPNQGLSVTDGKRTVVDKLDINGLSVGSIAVYGNDDANSTAQNATAGSISFDITYGSFDQSKLYFVPAGVMIGIGGLMIGLLIFKKRKVE